MDSSFFFVGEPPARTTSTHNRTPTASTRLCAGGRARSHGSHAVCDWVRKRYELIVGGARARLRLLLIYLELARRYFRRSHALCVEVLLSADHVDEKVKAQATNWFGPVLGAHIPFQNVQFHVADKATAAKCHRRGGTQRTAGANTPNVVAVAPSVRKPTGAAAHEHTRGHRDTVAHWQAL